MQRACWALLDERFRLCCLSATHEEHSDGESVVVQQRPCPHAEWREDELFAELPAVLRSEVAGVLLLGTLRCIPTFAECAAGRCAILWAC